MKDQYNVDNIKEAIILLQKLEEKNKSFGGIFIIVSEDEILTFSLSSEKTPENIPMTLLAEMKLASSSLARHIEKERKKNP